MIDFLTKSRAFRGIGASRARAIVEAAGDEFEETLKNDPRKLSEISGVQVGLVEALRDEWFDRLDENRAIAELAKWGVAPGSAQRLYKKFGASVVGMVEQDPYWLIGRVSGFGFKKIDAIALRVGFNKDHPTRVHEGILFALREQRNEGHTWIGLGDLVVAAQKLLTLDALGWEADIRTAIHELDQSERANLTEIPVNPDEGSPYTVVAEGGVWASEHYVRGKLGHAGRLEWTAHRVTEDEVRNEFPRLTDGQVRSVVNALSWRASVITGGAGVGKTFVVGIVDEVARNSGLRVIRVAPTGKAAKRMEESMKQPASTIHRALEPMVTEGEDGALNFSFAKGELDPLDADLVIVDEVSMVDVELCADLLSSIDFSRTTLLMVGDHNQLPPVGPGAVLRDLMSGKVVPSVVLDEVVRNAGVLKENISGVLGGRVAAGSEKSGRKDEGTPIEPWYVFTQFADQQSVRGTVRVLFEELLQRYTIVDSDGVTRRIDPVWDAQLLTPMHKTDIGTRELNALLQQVAQAKLGNDIEINASRKVILPGDKVIWTKNDYEREIFNGDVGCVVDKDKRSGGVTVDFGDDRLVEIASGRDQDPLQLAYALTVHKAQGSEYPVVVFVCQKAHTIMHHRGLFYTAVSRARQSAIVIGDRWSIGNCATKTKSDRRRTLLTLLEQGALQHA